MLNKEEIKENSCFYYMDKIPVIIWEVSPMGYKLGTIEAVGEKVDVGGYKRIQTLAPIPLTKSLLNKLSLEKQEYMGGETRYYDAQHRFMIPVTFDDKGQITQNSDLKFVHQLQQLYDKKGYRRLNFISILTIE